MKHSFLIAALVAASPADAAPPVSPPQSASPAIGQDWMAQQDNAGAVANPDPWPRADATGAGLDEMIKDERSWVKEALSPTRRGDDPAGPPADERILRTLRKVGGDSVIVPVLRLPLDRAR